MMHDMMKQCCSADGMSDFEKMKQFMEKCGKQDFSEEEFAMMKQLCGPEGKPDAKQMKQFMENCRCYVP